MNSSVRLSAVYIVRMLSDFELADSLGQSTQSFTKFQSKLERSPKPAISLSRLGQSVKLRNVKFGKLPNLLA